MGLRLNLGSGDRKAPEPWINVDVQPSTTPDVIADIRSLPFGAGRASAIYCGHILEHIPVEDVPFVMVSLRDILELNGHLCIVGPDYDRAVTEPDPVEREILCRLVKGIEHDGVTHSQRWDGDRHHWTATEAQTLQLVRDVFPGAYALPIAEVPTGWPTDWPVDTRSAWWQFAIIALKEG